MHQDEILDSENGKGREVRTIGTPRRRANIQRKRTRPEPKILHYRPTTCSASLHLCLILCIWDKGRDYIGLGFHFITCKTATELKRTCSDAAPKQSPSERQTEEGQ